MAIRRSLLIVLSVVLMVSLAACKSDDAVPGMVGDAAADGAGVPAATEVIADEAAQPVEQAAAPTTTDSVRVDKATVLNITGTVESRAYPNGEFAALTTGASVSVGDQIRTGTDGQVIL